MRPQIRFKEFTDDWEEKKLGEIATFLDNYRQPIRSEERKTGKYPYYGSTGIIDYVDNYIFEGTFLLLSEDGANIIDRNYRITYIASGKFWVNNHAHILDVKGNIYFLSELLEKLNYEKYNTGTVQPKLNKDVCQNIRIQLPSLPEQEKIGKFFSLLDQRIEKQERKVALLEEEKKGWMQKLFNQEIRFKGNYPDWNCNEIKNLISTISSKSYMTQKLEIDGQYPIYQQGDNSLFGYSNKCPYMDYSKCLLFGDHTLSLYKPQKPFLVSTDGIKIITFETMNRDFSYYMLQYYMPKSQGYKRHFSILKERIVFFPSLPEQEKIGNFFSLLDKRIEKEKEKLNLMKQEKKGFMQRMFI